MITERYRKVRNQYSNSLGYLTYSYKVYLNFKKLHELQTRTPRNVYKYYLNKYFLHGQYLFSSNLNYILKKKNFKINIKPINTVSFIPLFVLTVNQLNTQYCFILFNFLFVST